MDQNKYCDHRTTKIKLFSFNLHTSLEPATELALQFNQLSIAFIQEPHFTKKGLLSRLSCLNNYSFSDTARAARVASKELKIIPCPDLSSPDIACGFFSSYKKEKILLVSYYLDKTEPLFAYLTAFDKIRKFAADTGADIIFSGDANAHSTLWRGKQH